MNKTITFVMLIIKSRLNFCLNFSSAVSRTPRFQPLLNRTTCNTLLQEYANHRNLSQGKLLHSYMLVNGLLIDSPKPITSLVNMYSKCNRMKEAFLVFSSLSELHNVFTYNSIIAGFILNELPYPSIQFYLEMRFIGIMPDKFTFPCVIKAYSKSSDLKGIRKIHGLLFKFGLEFDLFVGSALVHAYLNFKLIEEAQEVFKSLSGKDTALWNAMINGYAHIEEFCKALELFQIMGKEGTVPNRFTVTGILSILAIKHDLDNGKAIHGFVIKMGYCSSVEVSNVLIDLYGKCNCIADALLIFEMMDEKDIYSWNSIIGVHEHCGYYDEAMVLFREMLDAGFQPDLVTVTIILPTCSHLAALMHGREIHKYMISNRWAKDGADNESYVNNVLMDMYAKCGSMKDAQMVFDSMQHKDSASWNIMIMGYGMHGFASEAMDIFSHMCEANLMPDEVTFVGVLSACCHAGLIRQGRELLMQMQSKYGVVPTIEHYTCVIDMLGRAGQLEDAYDLLSTMPIDANSVVWRAFLAACRLHGNAYLAEVAAQKVFDLEPEHCGSYVLMSNVYGSVGRYEEVTDMRCTMRQQNVRKTPGCSWIDFGSGVHIFVNGDRNHPEGDFIYTELNSLTSRLQEHGDVHDIFNDTT